MAEYVVEFGKDGRPVEPDGRLDAPAFHRNHQAIRTVLRQFLAGKSGSCHATQPSPTANRGKYLCWRLYLPILGSRFRVDPGAGQVHRRRTYGWFASSSSA